MALDDRRRAREIAEARYSFRWHFLAYIIVNPALVGLWYYTSASFFWPIFPIVFWGIGLTAHYLGAYRGGLGRDWVEKETDKIPVD